MTKRPDPKDAEEALKGPKPGYAWGNAPGIGAAVAAVAAVGHEEATRTIETVDHPAHYGGADDPYEAIKVIEAWSLGFCLGNAVKYICRAGKKGKMVEDLKKARWYLDREIERLEGVEDE